MDEPSILDYVKAKLNPRKYAGLIQSLSQREEQESPSVVPDILPPAVEGVTKKKRLMVPWKLIAAVSLALLAQFILEPPATSIAAAVTLYALAAALIVVAYFQKEIVLPAYPSPRVEPMSIHIRKNPLYFGLPIVLLAFLAFGGNRFTLINITLWILALVYFLSAFWLPTGAVKRITERITGIFNARELRIRINSWTLLLVLLFFLAAFFRFYRLDSVPGEAFSDHAEKLLDVLDILKGRTAIFFIRNTGREALQMYFTALVIKLMNSGVSFLSLKIGTALMGFLTLPLIFLLGRELGGSWVGLLSLFFAGIAYWPNVISRVGLRFPLYPLFVAPTLFFLIRGLRRSSRNDFILAGLTTGLSLHGYSPARFIPVVVVAGVVIFLLHSRSRGKRWETIFALILLAFIGLIVFLPLLRYSLENPQNFGLRAMSRLSSWEREIPGSPLQIFFSNLLKSLIMPFWKNGSTWVHSVTNRPALDVVTAAFFFVGMVLVFARYLRERNWLDLFLLLSIPLLMMPSILSLAFPEENPALNRSGGAMIPIFIIAAMGCYGVFSSLWEKGQGKLSRTVVAVFAMTLAVISVAQNYDLVFQQYNRQFMSAAWNSSEMGETIASFVDTVGTRDSAYVVPYPHWVDTRLVGINAGFPEKDYALWPDDIAFSLQEKGAKLFIVKPTDEYGIGQLMTLYPEGVFSLHQSEWPGKDYLIFYIPPVDSLNPLLELEELDDLSVE